MTKEVKKAIEDNIKGFSSGDLKISSETLLNILGYQSNKKTLIDLESLKNRATEKGLKSTYSYLWESIKSADLVFQYTADEIKQQESLFNSNLVDRDQPASYLFFVLELKKTFYTRNQLSDISRAINKLFPMHVFMFIKYGMHLSLSLIDRRPNLKITDRDVLEKVSHIFNISIEKPHAAHVQILSSLSFDSIRAEAPRNRIESFKDLQNGWRKVINTDILNKQFYLDYQKLSVKLIKAIFPKQVENKLIAHQGVLNMLNRIMFLYFVQKKEWIMKDENFIYHFWNAYKNTGHKDKFHDDWLNSIFFYAFNGTAYKTPKVIKALPEPYKSEITNFPFLNGGLFAKNDEQDSFILTDNYFEDIFNFFEGYIFTITEDTPYDVNIEINPELLGKMYEGMINATDLNDVDAENGIVYTERPEINFMTRRSFVEVLDKKLNSSLSRDFLYHFVFDNSEQKKEILEHYKPDKEKLRKAITTATICDPACGSGSMLLGAIQVQMELLRVLDETNNNQHSQKDDFNLKKQLISECIYGVDIKEWAVRIAELRL